IHPEAGKIKFLGVHRAEFVVTNKGVGGVLRLGEKRIAVVTPDAGLLKTRKESRLLRSIYGRQAHDAEGAEYNFLANFQKRQQAGFWYGRARARQLELSRKAPRD